MGQWDVSPCIRIWEGFAPDLLAEMTWPPMSVCISNVDSTNSSVLKMLSGLALLPNRKWIS